ncbi:MAG: YbfB/YjiJ family MFS transporter [Peptococcaceae bacterium]|nr:YbfB/YjiJ family MFS transporter [Peptococcaceae bacterium]
MKNKMKFQIHYGWFVLTIGTLAIIGAIGFSRFSFSTVLPYMQADLGIDNGQAGFLATMSFLGYLTLALIGGALASKYGSRLIATFGLTVAGLGMVFTGLSSGYSWVAVFCLMAGLGSGAVHLSIFGLWPAWFTKSKRGLASGIAISGGPLGMILAGCIVPVFAFAYGQSAWRASWILFGSFTLLAALLTFLFIRNYPAEKNLKPVGFTGETDQPPNNYRKSSDWKYVYTLPLVWILGIIYFAFGFTYIIYMTFFVKHLVADIGVTAVLAARLFMILGWISLISGIIWGWLSDVVGRRITLVSLLALQAAASVLFSVGETPLLYISSTFLYGFSVCVPAIMAVVCGDFLGPELASAGLGFVTLFFGLGQVLGPVVGGFMADAFGSFAPVFIMTAAIALVGAVISLLFVKNFDQVNKPGKLEQQ